MPNWLLSMYKFVGGSMPKARTTDIETSHEAAELAKPNAEQDRALALRSLGEKPMTDYELSLHTGRYERSIGKRRTDLYQAGYVTFLTDENGNKVKRPTATGAKAIVWTLTTLGRIEAGLE